MVLKVRLASSISLSKLFSLLVVVVSEAEGAGLFATLFLLTQALRLAAQPQARATAARVLASFSFSR